MIINKICGIYKILNVIDNNKYIGSSNEIEKREYTHFNNLRNNNHINSKLQEAYNIVGEKNFKFSIIKEVRFPINYNSFNIRKGLEIIEQAFVDYLDPEYNICKKIVSSRLGVKHSEEAKNKMSESHKGKILSRDHIEKIRKANTGKSCKYKGIKKDRSIIEKIILKINKKVDQYSINGEYIKSYISIKQASEITNIIPQNISACCNNITKIAGNYIWKFSRNENNKIEPYIRSTAKQILQFKDNTLIKEYNSILEASKILECDKSAISRCLNGKSKTSMGFLWKFKDKN